MIALRLPKTKTRKHHLPPVWVFLGTRAWEVVKVRDVYFDVPLATRRRGHLVWEVEDELVQSLATVVTRFSRNLEAAVARLRETPAEGGPEFEKVFEEHFSSFDAGEHIKKTLNWKGGEIVFQTIAHYGAEITHNQRSFTIHFSENGFDAIIPLKGYNITQEDIELIELAHAFERAFKRYLESAKTPKNSELDFSALLPQESAEEPDSESKQQTRQGEDQDRPAAQGSPASADDAPSPRQSQAGAERRSQELEQASQEACSNSGNTPQGARGKPSGENVLPEGAPAAGSSRGETAAPGSGERAAAFGDGGDAAEEGAASSAEGTEGLGEPQEALPPERSRVPSLGAAQAEAAGLQSVKELWRSIRRAGQGPASGTDRWGGVFASPTPPSPSTIREARQLFRALQEIFYSEEAAGPRVDYKKASVKFATLRLPTIRDHKIEFGRPGVAVFADVSGSMSDVAEEFAKIARAVQIANPDTVRIAGAQSNGWPAWYWASAHTTRPIEVSVDDYDKIVDWYLELFRKHDVKICVMLADTDGAHIYRRLAKHVQVVWIDVYAGNYGEPKVDEKESAGGLLRIIRANTTEKVLRALRLAVDILKKGGVKA
ncbi:MAG: hypothetical protein QW512_00480 [Thermofilaceae archaeon]